MVQKVRTAFDSPQATWIGNVFRPDIVLLDVRMPTMSGYEVARWFRDQPWGRDVMIVGVTGLHEEEDRANAIAAGFDSVFVKPLEDATIQRILNMCEKLAAART